MRNNQLNKTTTFKTGKDILNLLSAKEKRSSKSMITPPSTETEFALFDIWKTVLGNDDFGVTDDFFKIGGNSLKAVQLTSRISRRLSVNIILTDIFLQPTISKLAAHILKPSTDLLFSSTIEINARPQYIPLSFSQERLWFIDQLEGSVQYHLPYVLRLKGKLDKDAMDYALQTFVNRHEILRTVICSENGVGYQFIKDENTWELCRVDGSHYADKPEELNYYIANLIRKPFDLSQDHLVRATLIKLAEDKNIFVATLHHIASDGWSKSIFVKELVQLYNTYKDGSTIDLPPLNLQYADYAIWQRKNYQGEWFSNKLSYWKKKLENITPLELPTDFMRPAVQSIKGAKIDFTIDEQLLNGLQQLSQQQGVTLFMTLVSVFKVLLHRYSSQEDISVGTPVANRTFKEIEELVGFFVNTLVLRSEVNSNTKFVDFLQQVKVTALEAYVQQDVPFEKVVEAVVKERDPARNPLFQVMFILQNVPELCSADLAEVQISREVYQSNTAQFDLSLIIREGYHVLNAAVEYCTDLFSPQTMERMIGHYQELLSSIVKQPHQKIGLLPMLTSAEEHQLLIEFNSTKVDYPKGKTIVDLFEEQVVKTPGATALVFQEEKLSYEVLNKRANQLAHYLKSKGVKEETLVPICIERSPQMIVGILGILKAGGAYVPIDPEYPQERISYMLNDTGSSIIVSSKKSEIKIQSSAKVEVIEIISDWRVINGQSTENLQITHQPNHLAYVIYTSGSTGKPKGVMIEHHNAYSFICWCKQEYSQSNFEIVYAGTSICFDLSVFEIFYPLSLGRSLRVIESGLSIREYLQNDTNVLINSVPSVVQNLVNDFTDLKNISVLNMAGEPIPLQVQHALDADKIEIRNLYGPTEDTTYSTVHRLKNGEPATIGRPISNTNICIVNNEMELVPIGHTGEICIGGSGLARGYLNRIKLTGEKFIENPFSKIAGARLYRTGDLGKWLSDGSINYLGRLDNQVKINGYRIELGEIESVLLQCTGVEKGIVLSRKNNNGNKQLMGYVITKEIFNKEALIAELKSKLPEYMVPLIWIEMQSFPLTTNGKIDRKAFPEPDSVQLSGLGYLAPRSEIEEKLTDIWQELLGVEKIGVYDNFFDLGGHSLLVIRVISAIRKRLNAEVAIKDLFNNPSIVELANHLNVFNRSLLNSIQVELRPEFIPLSFGQERLWFIDQLGGSLQYQSSAVWGLGSQLNKSALDNALRQIVIRHEAIRTVIMEHDGIPYQFILDLKNWKLEMIDGSFVKENDDLKNYIQKLMRMPFDLTKDYMVRAFLIKNSDEYKLIITTHHIASDGWSRSIFLKELSEVYNATVEDRPVQLPTLSVQYADYSNWQRTDQQDKLDKKIEYWAHKLEGTTALQLPTDYSRPAVFSTRGAVKKFTINKILSSQLKNFSQQYGATLFMTLLSAFKVFLYRYSGQKDICVGFPIANRVQQEVEGLIGFFANTLALRSEVNGDATFIELMKQVKTTTLEAYEHQEVPFEKIVNLIAKERDMSRNPVFQIMFVLQNTPEIPTLELVGVQVSKEEYERKFSTFDLTFNILETPTGFIGTVEYCIDLFKEETILRMVDHYTILLASIVEEPFQKIDLLPMLSAGEEHQLLYEFNKTSVAYPKDKTIIDLFEEQVNKTPDTIAVVFDEQQLTYMELNAKANQLAHHLRQKGVHEETLIPICIERSLEMMICILGILKAGGAYVPIDPNYPFERIKYMLLDTAAKLVVSGKQSRMMLPVLEGVEIIEIDGNNESLSKLSTTNLAITIKPDNLVYAIYTSGSTGNPKGVMIEERSVINLLFSVAEKVQFTSNSTFLSVTTYSFDICYLELFMPLINGGKLIIVPREISSDGYKLAETISYHRPSHMQGTPSTWQLLLDAEWENKEGIKMLIGGEAVQEEIKEALTTKGLVWNVYGPTETTIWSAIKQLTKAEKVSIGTPIANTEMYIITQKNQLAPIGIPGEICIGGVGLARGYINLPQLTSEKFINNTFSKGSRLYKTGDWGRWLPDGNIECLGRMDDQVKIRGYRIELGEIETVLLQSGLVKQVVIIAKEDQQNNKRLVGYIIVEGIFNKQAVTNYLYSRLPDYMVPAVWMELENFPLTPNGKIDKNAFPEPKLENHLNNKFESPQTEVEKTLASIWQQLLHLENIGIYDNFFELGGHSLLIMRMSTYIKKAFSISIPIYALFQFTTVNDLSKYLELELQKKDFEKENITGYKIVNI